MPNSGVRLSIVSAISPEMQHETRTGVKWNRLIFIDLNECTKSIYVHTVPKQTSSNTMTNYVQLRVNKQKHLVFFPFPHPHNSIPVSSAPRRLFSSSVEIKIAVNICSNCKLPLCDNLSRNNFSSSFLVGTESRYALSSEARAVAIKALIGWTRNRIP